MSEQKLTKVERGLLVKLLKKYLPEVEEQYKEARPASSSAWLFSQMTQAIKTLLEQLEP